MTNHTNATAPYQGVIILESLKDDTVLKECKVVTTRVEQVTPRHYTPHLKQWTLHTVEIQPGKADRVANILSQSLHGGAEGSSWYADYRNSATHYIIFPGKIFKVNRQNPKEYAAVTNHGLTLGIPAHQLVFSPELDV